MNACHVGSRNECELLDRRLAELRRGLADEVLPELAGDLGLLGRGREAYRRLLEAFRLERSGERLLHDEHDAVPALPEDVPDPDAVVRRPVRPFREEPMIVFVSDTAALSSR